MSMPAPRKSASMVNDGPPLALCFASPLKRKDLTSFKIAITFYDHSGLERILLRLPEYVRFTFHSIQSLPSQSGPFDSISIVTFLTLQSKRARSFSCDGPRHLKSTNNKKNHIWNGSRVRTQRNQILLYTAGISNILQDVICNIITQSNMHKIRNTYSHCLHFYGLFRSLRSYLFSNDKQD